VVDAAQRIGMVVPVVERTEATLAQVCSGVSPIHLVGLLAENGNIEVSLDHGIREYAASEWLQIGK
jgi:hypothetical protein